jgi:predicted Zn-dependent protease
VNRTAQVDSPAHGGEALLELAEWAVGELKGTADYVQVFAESSLSVKVENLDGEVLATCVEPRDGMGCLVRQDDRWRYRAVPSTELAELVGWLGLARSSSLPEWRISSEAEGFSPLAARSWLASGESGNLSVRAVEAYTNRSIAVVDTEGIRASSSSRAVRQRVEATIIMGGRRYRGLSRWFRRGQDEEPHPGGDHLTRIALGHARDAAKATMHGKQRTPVVLGPSAAAAFLHELVGHALEGDNFALDSAYMKGLRKPGALPLSLSLHDDPTIPHGYGSYEIDDEGGSACATVLLDNGEIGSPLTSVRVVDRDGYRPTSNGRRWDYRELAIPRASNTVALPGTEDPANLLESSHAGLLYVGCLGAGVIHLSSGEFSFAGLNCAYISPAGDRVPVRDVSLVGDALKTLARLEAIGSDFGGDSATCGKQGQLIGIGLYSSSMRYAALDWSAV